MLTKCFFEVFFKLQVRKLGLDTEVGQLGLSLLWIIFSSAQLIVRDNLVNSEPISLLDCYINSGF